MNTEKSYKIVYVASRYAGDISANATTAISYCRYVIDQGCMPIASHLLYPQMLNDNIPAERELGLTFGNISSGMIGEIEEANRLNKPVIYFEEVPKDE